MESLFELVKIIFAHLDGTHSSQVKINNFIIEFYYFGVFIQWKVVLENQLNLSVRVREFDKIFPIEISSNNRNIPLGFYSQVHRI